LYTDDDMALMQHAWELTAAHREDLAGRSGNPQDTPALVAHAERRSVLDLLHARPVE
jgi:hypothetical protein